MDKSSANQKTKGEVLFSGGEGAAQELANPLYFHVILAGIKGGGRNLTGLREHIGKRGMVVASLSTREALKRNEFKLKTHYQNLAREIVNQAQNRTIRIYAHSLGGLEVLDLLKELLKDESLPNKALELIFISPPGIGRRGFSGLFEVGKRMKSLLETLGLYDQFYLFPSIPAITGNQETRSRQREIFLNEWLPRLVVDAGKRAELVSAFQRIDRELLELRLNSALADNEEYYRRQRHLLMKPLLEQIICGEHITEEIHQQQLTQNHELGRDIHSRLAYRSLIVGFTFRVLKTLFVGIDRKILRVFEACQRMNIDLKLGVVILGKDRLIQLQDYDKLNRIARLKGRPVEIKVFENEEHSSVAYKWELIDALEELVFGPTPASQAVLPPA
jgi:hypothetical protein